jgi:uncharacterized phiE125 gp8 family phage protein
VIVTPNVNDIVTLADTKTFLNISGTQYDGELPSFITSASDMIESRIGPVAGSPTYDEWYDGGSTQIVLRHSPVQSVASITESYGGTVTFQLSKVVLDAGVPMGTYGYTFDASNGLITRRAAGGTIPFPAGTMNIHVIYTAGFIAPPAELQTACKILVKHLWETRRGGAKRPGLGGNDEASLKDEGDFPARVEEILANFYIPGIA